MNIQFLVQGYPQRIPIYHLLWGYPGNYPSTFKSIPGTGIYSDDARVTARERPMQPGLMHGWVPQSMYQNNTCSEGARTTTRNTIKKIPGTGMYSGDTQVFSTHVPQRIHQNNIYSGGTPVTSGEATKTIPGLVPGSRRVYIYASKHALVKQNTIFIPQSLQHITARYVHAAGMPRKPLLHQRAQPSFLSSAANRKTCDHDRSALTGFCCIISPTTEEA